MATGHYARVKKDEQTGRYLLCKGIDQTKDQSYALYHLNQHTLSHFLMPLGDFTKIETRQMARELKLPVAEKPDSQEICFIPNDDYKSFLSEHAPQALKPGNFVDTSGRIIGRHKGLPLYTVGQRKGLGLAAGKPLYVLELNTELNEIVLGFGQDVFADELIAGDINYISMDKFSKPIKIKAKIRYGAKESDAVVTPMGDDRVHVKFDQPQRAITPGQSVVFYDGDVVVGGGIILKSDGYKWRD
jgi:tRNA-specific 2-thiouridylase